MPLLYTMEVWELGETAGPRHALIGLLLAFVPVALLVASSGFRRRPDLSRLDVLIDVVTAMGLGLVSAGVVLVMLQRGTVATPLPIALQMIAFEAAPFAIGAAVATEVFTRATDRPQRQEEEGQEVSAAMLLFFGNLDVAAPVGAGLAHTVVLGFPASIGGAAGRLVV